MAPRFVAPCRQGDKNDGIDTEAICETVSHPGTRFVPVKNVIQKVKRGQGDLFQRKIIHPDPFRSWMLATIGKS